MKPYNCLYSTRGGVQETPVRECGHLFEPRSIVFINSNKAIFGLFSKTLPTVPKFPREFRETLRVVRILNKGGQYPEKP